MWLFLSMLTTACATRSVPPIDAAGGPFPADTDEIALWARAAKEEDSLLKRTRAYDDPLLEDYLRRVVERLVPASVRAVSGLTFTVRVLRDPTVNAFALPNGHIFVHTGLLSALENEAQLATILAHETAHVVRRHALQVSRDGRHAASAPTTPGIVSATARARAGSVQSAILSETAGAILGLGLKLTAAASMTGHGRGLERDADRGGMEALVRAGYDPAQAPRVFDTLRQRATDGGVLETFFLGNPRRLEERGHAARRLLKTQASAAPESGWVKDTVEFQLRIPAVIRDNAYEDVRAGRFALARRQLDRVFAMTPHDAAVHLYDGDLYRLQAQRDGPAVQTAENIARARASYERAIELDPAMAEPHRQLGLLYYQQADTAKAAAAFEQYLALKPAAPDAERIKEYILRLAR